MARKYPEIARCTFDEVELVNPRKLSDPTWRPELTTAHRRVTLNFMGIGLIGQADIKKLEKILYIADREFEIVANYCNAEVLPHKWVFLEDDCRIGLAAEVPRIRQTEGVSPGNKIQNGVIKYNRTRRWLPWGLADIACRQFVTGSTTDTTAATNIFCDIDPLFRRPMSLC